PSAALGPGSPELEFLRRLERRGGTLLAVVPARSVRRAGLDHDPDAPAGIGGRDALSVAALDGEEVGGALVGDLRAEDLVDHALALEPAHRGFVLQLEHVAATVVVERLRLALDDVALGLAHLPEPGRVPRGGREMVAGLVLAQHDAIGQHRQLAADHVDAAGEDVHLAGIVIGHVVRLDLDGRVAVGLDPLRASGVPGEQQDEHQRRRDGDARSHGRGGASAAGSGCHWPRTSESTRSWRAALSNSMPTPVKVDSPRRMRTGRSVRATSVTESTIAKSVSTVMRGTPGAGSRTRRTSSISSVIRPSASVRARLAVRRTVGRSGSRLTSTGAS